MLTGWFDEGRPYIEARLDLPRLGHTTRLTLLVDTGADGSVLMPRDGRMMGVDYSALRNPVPLHGVGGSTMACYEHANLWFQDGQKGFGYDVALAIVLPFEEDEAIGSLLGRDVLDRWRMDYFPLGTSLQFDVQSCDFAE